MLKRIKNRKFSLGQRIALALGTFLSLAIIMSVIGQQIANSSEEAAQEMVTLNYYETFINLQYQEELKFAYINGRIDTLAANKVEFDHMNLNAYHSFKEMRWACIPHSTFQVDRNKSLALHLQYDKTGNATIDAVMEGSLIRKENVGLIREIKESLKSSPSGQRILPLIYEAITNEHEYGITNDTAEYIAFVENIQNAKQLAISGKYTAVSNKLLQYGTNVKDLIILDKKTMTLINASEQTWKATWDYPYQMKTVIHRYMVELGKKIKTLYLIIVLLIILLGSAFTFFITRNISTGAAKNLEALEAISDGNLNVEFDERILSRSDEFGKLANAMQTMADKLRSIINDISKSAENVQNSASQLSSSSNEISKGANMQAASLEEISSSMEEIVSNIEQNADHATTVQKMALGVSTDMEKVNATSEKSIQSIREITTKISIINDIAFQTNLLALNAAVEAARAGEHGKGFAVVALEVRRLAERTRIASDEIHQISARCVEVTEEASRQLTDIIPNIKNTAQIVQQIAVASIEQRGGVEQINNAIQSLNQITQQNASTSVELSSKSEEMDDMAKNLTDQISYFDHD